MAVAIIFVVSSNLFLGPSGPPIAVAFPGFIAILVPLRERLLPRWFTSEELDLLDPVQKPLEDVDNDLTAYARTSNVAIVARSSEPSFSRSALIKTEGLTPGLLRVQSSLSW